MALDAPVRTYLPDLRLQDEATAARVTIGDLMDHSAGWYGDEGIYTGEGDDGIARYVTERLPQLPQLFPLGRFFSYNNAAFTLLGRLIEVVSGTIYNTAMQNLLLGPLGLTETVLDRREVLQRSYSDGHYAGPINGQDSVAVQSPMWVPRSVDPADSDEEIPALLAVGGGRCGAGGNLHHCPVDRLPSATGGSSCG